MISDLIKRADPSMKEQLITFETARLAKELGFDWECNIAWLLSDRWGNLEGKNVRTGDIIKVDMSTRNFCNTLNNNIYKNVKPKGCKEICAAPTQSVLQKWLRDKYNVHIEIIPDEEDPKNLWWSVVYHLDNMQEPTSNGPFETFEIALEKGLQEALKLIKDESEKSKSS